MKRIIYPQVALQKAMAYCSKMERSRFDVKNKFYKWGISVDVSEKLLNQLVEEGFINDDRHMLAYIKGKFYMNKWGKVKIKYGLKLNGYSEEVADNYLDSAIEEKEYRRIIEEQIAKKNKSINIEDEYLRKAKLIRFAQSRGYETEIALEIVDNLIN